MYLRRKCKAGERLKIDLDVKSINDKQILSKMCAKRMTVLCKRAFVLLTDTCSGFLWKSDDLFLRVQSRLRAYFPIDACCDDNGGTCYVVTIDGDDLNSLRFAPFDRRRGMFISSVSRGIAADKSSHFLEIIIKVYLVHVRNTNLTQN